MQFAHFSTLCELCVVVFAAFVLKTFKHKEHKAKSTKVAKKIEIDPQPEFVRQVLQTYKESGTLWVLQALYVLQRFRSVRYSLTMTSTGSMVEARQAG